MVPPLISLILFTGSVVSMFFIKREQCGFSWEKYNICPLTMLDENDFYFCFSVGKFSLWIAKKIWVVPLLYNETQCDQIEPNIQKLGIAEHTPVHTYTKYNDKTQDSSN